MKIKRWMIRNPDNSASLDSQKRNPLEISQLSSHLSNQASNRLNRR